MADEWDEEFAESGEVDAVDAVDDWEAEIEPEPVDNANIADDWEAESDGEEDEKKAAAPIADIEDAGAKKKPVVAVKKGKGKHQIVELKSKGDEKDENKTTENSAEEARRLAALVRERDLELTMELFGGSKDDDDNSAPAPVTNPTTVAEFSAFADSIGSKLSQFSGNDHFISFLKDVVVKATSGMHSEDMKELIGSLNAVLNEMIKAEKSTKGKKKKGKKKAPQLHSGGHGVGRSSGQKDLFDDALGGDGSLADDEYDFM